MREGNPSGHELDIPYGLQGYHIVVILDCPESFFEKEEGFSTSRRPDKRELT